MSKKEEDIISIVPNSNYLTVHETKLKVSVWWDVFLDIACYRCNIKLECLSCVDFMLLLCDHFSVSSTLQQTVQQCVGQNLHYSCYDIVENIIPLNMLHDCIRTKMDYTSFSGLTDICYLNFLHHVCEIEMVKLHTISVMFIKNDFHLHIHIMRKLGMNDEASGEINDQAFINRTICQA